MANRRRWSSTVGNARGMRVRVYEREPGGTLYCAAWVPGSGFSRRSLGHTDKRRALREAKQLALLRPKGESDECSPLALKALFERYLTQATHSRDGSLKTEAYRRDCKRRAERLVKWFGAHCEVPTLTPDRMEAYVRARRAGQINGRQVRARSVQCDLVLLKGMLRWATGVFESGKPLLDRSPLSTYAPPRERDPRRPLIDGGTVQALMGVSARVDVLLGLLIVLMDTTGRRLSSVLGLRWDDFDFERRTITWRPELDKRRRSWVTPMPSRAREALLHYRSEHPRIGTALVFPSQGNPSKPVSKYVAEAWLERAFKKAGLTHPRGGLWHMFRRKWATERKNYPLRDVAAAGGWSDVHTLLTCYQQPDDETLRAVVEGEKQTQKQTQVN